MKYQEWQKNTRFVAMTGYTEEKFRELLPYFQEAHDEYLSKYRMDGKRRRGLRAYTMYANSPLLCMEERPAFILSYLKLNPIQEAHASFRVRVEHAIGSIKRYRTVKDECRLRKNLFVESVFSTCAALHNFRIKDRTFAYENKLT
jgi:hypothetical protein